MKNDRTENHDTLRTIGQRGGTKFDNIQRTLLGGAAAFLHNLHVAPLDAWDPIQCSRPAARPPAANPPGAPFPHNPLQYNIIYVQRGVNPVAAEIEAVLSFRVDNNENGRVRAAAATGCETQKTKRCPILFG